MAFHIRDDETDALVRRLASQRGTGLTETVKSAIKAELKRDRAAVPLRERVRSIQARISAAEPTGLIADKAFFDTLSGD